MRTIIAGSRTITNPTDISDAVHFSKFPITTVLSGGAKGADFLGEQWAALWNIPVEVYPADWEKYGRSAGFKRNALMATKADALIAVWDGESRGTRHMVATAEALKLKIFVYPVYKNES